MKGSLCTRGGTWIKAAAQMQAPYPPREGKIIMIRKPLARNTQVGAPQTPIILLHPKRKTQFKVPHIVLPDPSFTRELNEVQWNTSSRTETQTKAGNTMKCFSKGWKTKGRGENRGGCSQKRTGEQFNKRHTEMHFKFH